MHAQGFMSQTCNIQELRVQECFLKIMSETTYFLYNVSSKFNHCPRQNVIRKYNQEQFAPMLARAYNSNNEEPETGIFYVWDHPTLHSEFQASLSCIVRSCFKKQKSKKKDKKSIASSTGLEILELSTCPESPLPSYKHF